MNYTENEYVNILLQKLNVDGGQWELGDEEENYKGIKSVDLVNHIKKLAIEVKDDLSDPAPDISQYPGVIFEKTRDLLKLSKRYKNDIDGAHKKFKNYENYETAVIIRFNDFTFQTIHYLLGGLVRLTQYGRVPNLNYNITRDAYNCSIFIFHNIKYDQWEFYRNPLSKRPSNMIVPELHKLDLEIKEIKESDLLS